MERRDLQGLTVSSDSGKEAVVTKGGFPVADADPGSGLEVPFEYRGMKSSVTLALDAEAAAVQTAIAAMLPQLDELADMVELVGTEVSA